MVVNSNQFKSAHDIARQKRKNVSTTGRWGKTTPNSLFALAHQNRTIAIASDFRVDGAKSPEIPQNEGVLGSEIAARNHKSLATFHRTLKSQCSIAFSCFGNRCVFWGPRWASQSQIAKIAAISVRKSLFAERLLTKEPVPSSLCSKF